jgi:hypothetical protein
MLMNHNNWSEKLKINQNLITLMRFSTGLRRFCETDGDSESLNVVANDEKLCSLLLIIDTST